MQSISSSLPHVALLFEIKNAFSEVVQLDIYDTNLHSAANVLQVSKIHTPEDGSEAFNEPLCLTGKFAYPSFNWADKHYLTLAPEETVCRGFGLSSLWDVTQGGSFLLALPGGRQKASSIQHQIQPTLVTIDETQWPKNSPFQKVTFRNPNLPLVQINATKQMITLLPNTYSSPRKSLH